MPQRVGEVVLHQLGHAGGAAGEVHQHHIVPAGGLIARRALEGLGASVHLRVQVEPALPGRADQYPVLKGRYLRRGQLHLLHHERVVHADHGLHPGGVAAVHDVLLSQLQRGGDQYDAQLVQRRGAHPVLPAAAQYHHHHVALFEPQAPQEVGHAVGQLHDVGEGEGLLLPLLADPQKRPLVGLLLGPGVHHVVAEVEVLRHVDGELLPECLVAVKLDLRQEFIQQVIHAVSPLTRRSPSESAP